MEMPMDILNKRLGKIRDNGDIDFDNTAAAVDIDTELQSKFLFFPIEEIEAVEIEENRGHLYAGSGPEHCAAAEADNPNWLYNHAVHALALYWHLKKVQDAAADAEKAEAQKLAARPEPGVYQGNGGIHYFTVIVTADRRVLVGQKLGGYEDQSDLYDRMQAGFWNLQRVDVTDGTVSA